MLKSSGSRLGSFSGVSSGDKPTNQQSSKNHQKETSKIQVNDYVPKRFGLKYDPPTIILEYLVPSSGKLYHHKMKLLKLKPESKTSEMIEYLQNRHPHYFFNNKISDNQITNLIEKLKRKLGIEGETGSTFITGFAENKKENSTTANSQGKLASFSSSTSKSIVNNNTSTSDSEPTSVKFNLGSKPKLVTSSGFSKQSDKKPEIKKEGSSSVKTEKEKKDGNGFWDFEEIDLDESDEEAPKVDYNTTNLNKLSKDELDKHKKQMDKTFNKNQKKPGDIGFIYDKQEEFQPKEPNEWDDDF